MNQLSSEQQAAYERALEAFRKEYGREPNGMEKFMLIAKVRGLM